MRRLVALVILLGVFGNPNIAGASSDVLLSVSEHAFIEAHPVIRIGPDPAFVPFEFIDSQGVYRGIAADILDIVEEKTGLEFVLVGSLSWQEVTGKALQREIDLLPAVGKTSEREQHFLFTRAYMNFQRTIVVKDTNRSINSFEDLYGRQVAVQANSSHHGFLLDHPEILLRTYDTVLDALQAVDRGEEVAFVGNEATTRYMIGANGMVGLSSIPFDTGAPLQLHMAVRGDWPQLVSILDKSLESIGQADYSKIYQKWITVEQRFDYTPFIIAGVVLGGLVLVILVVSSFWIIRLRREILRKEIAQREMESAIGRAEDADREKSRFMARMSHEIRTPLNGINGMSYLLDGTKLDTTQKRYLHTIQKAVSHMLAIINDIIEYSRIEEKSLPLESVPFKLDEVVQHVISLESDLIGRKHLRLQLEWESDVPVHVLGDPNRLGQVITNLLHNAIKFTEDGTIGIRAYRIEAEDDRCRLMFEITDTGIGMTEQQQELIFKPFSQADASISRKYGGSGLGLSIVKSLVDMMGGTISLQSEVGKGSRFSVELPFLLDVDGEREDDRRIIAHELGPVQVLVLAKDGETRKSMELALRRIGIVADYVGSSSSVPPLLSIDEALCERLLLLDIDVDDGVTKLLSSLNKDFSFRKYLKLVALVGSGDASVAETLRNLGVDLVLPKPILPSLLFNSILDLFSGSLVSPVAERPTTPGSTKGTILVVEDNEVNRTIASEVLERDGYRVLIAENGSEGCRVFEENHDSIDLVLMDLHMDVMDGFEAVKRIRSTGATVPVFAVSADVVGDIAERTEKAGFTRIVPKPYDPASLLREIERTLDSNKPNGYGKAPFPKKNRSALDVEKGLKQVDGDIHLYRKIIGLYRHEMKADFVKLEKGVVDGNRDLVAQMSHKFKGGAFTVGSGQLGEMASVLQQLAQDGESDLMQYLDLFRDELFRVYGEMEQYLAIYDTKHQ